MSKKRSNRRKPGGGQATKKTRPVVTAPRAAVDTPAVFESGEPITLGNITVPDRLRALREDKVAELAGSFAETGIGLINSITVRAQRSGFVLVTGRHRLEAARRCGWKSIRCTVLHDIDADQAEIIEIDENLIRAELSPAERAAHVARRKKLFEKAHPETKHGATGRGRGKSRQVGDSNARFTKDTAGKTGQSERSVQRDAARGENIKVLPDIVGTSLDEGAELDAMAKLSEPKQRELAKRAKAGEKVSAKPARAKPVGAASTVSTASLAAQPAATDGAAREPAAKTPAAPRDVGPYSTGEHDRLRARNDALNEENRALQFRISGLESEIAELKERNAGLEARIAELVEKSPTPDGAAGAATTAPRGDDLDVRDFAGGSLRR